MSKYDFKLDLDTNNPVKMIVDKISPNSKILEFGPAHGRLTRYLKEHLKCTIDIIELDQESGEEAGKYANIALIGVENGNIDNLKWYDILKNEKYDFIIFADVLEHLRDPKTVLQKCKLLLKDEGSMLLSVPNLAHNSVMIGLYNDMFDYNKIGLLDNTHIHFFSYYSLRRMIIECELIPIMQKAAYARVGEIEIPYTYKDVPSNFAKELMKRPYGNLYSFVFEVKKRETVYTQNVTQLAVLNMDEFSHYHLECYIKQKDMEFSENNKILKYVNPTSDSIRLPLHDYSRVSDIMLSLIDTNAIIEIKNIYYTKDGQQYNCGFSTNALKLSNDIYIFKSDQNIFIKFDEKDIDDVTVNIKYISYDLDLIDILYNRVMDKVQQLNERLSNIVNEKDSLIQTQSNIISEKDVYITEQTQMIDSNNQHIAMLKDEIGNLEKEYHKVKDLYNKTFIRKIKRLIKSIIRRG